MDQEKIGKLIKDIRIKNKLSQEKFGEKYHVTYQAVSKWENGKNLPDISILKQICKDYNVDINNLLIGRKRTKKRLIIIISLSIILMGAIFFLIYKTPNKNDFELKPLTTTCKDFNLYGTIAYSDNKTSIYISNITYCGEEDKTLYKKIECTLYENDGETKTKIDSITSKNMLLEKFLKGVNFQVEHYSKSCQMYKKNRLHLEIEAENEQGIITYYKIPLELEENCN